MDHGARKLAEKSKIAAPVFCFASLYSVDERG
jgi:hypothetical protein